jgi:hypothetical protein
MVLRPNTKQQNKSIWCIMDIPNLFLEPWQTMIGHPLEQWSQTNMVATSYDFPYKMHCKSIRTMANDGSTWP